MLKKNHFWLPTVLPSVMEPLLPKQQGKACCSFPRETAIPFAFILVSSIAIELVSIYTWTPFNATSIPILIWILSLTVLHCIQLLLIKCKKDIIDTSTKRVCIAIICLLISAIAAFSLTSSLQESFLFCFYQYLVELINISQFRGYLTKIIVLHELCSRLDMWRSWCLLWRIL